MVKDFRVFDSSDFNLNSYGLGLIEDTIQLTEHQEINGLYSLNFSIPSDSPNKVYLETDDITQYLFAIEDRIYYPIEINHNTDSQIIEVSCRSVITLLDKYIFVNIYPIQVNVNCKSVMETTMQLREPQEDYREFSFSLFTPEELRERGMVWVSERFDILNGFDYVSAYDMIGNCINLAGRGELYFENFKFAIVERIGKDTDEVWDKEENVSSLTLTKNYDELMNIILIEGKDGMPMDLTRYPNSVIVDSESLRTYGVRRGHINFTDIDNKEDLERRALWEINPLNPERVSVHKESLSVSAYDVGENIGLGDTVRVLSRYDNIDKEKRIIARDINWNDRGQDTFELGDKAMTELQLLTKLEAMRQTVNNITTSNGDVDTSFINLIVSAIEGRNRCKNSRFSVFDRLNLPKHWETQNAYVTSTDARFGTFSLSLVDYGIAISDAMDSTNWRGENTATLIQVWHKGSFEIIVAGCDDEGNLDEDNPIIIPHQTKYSSSKTARSQFSSNYWSSTPAYLVVDNEDIPENGYIRLIMQGVTLEPVLIGGVFVGAGNLSQIKLYSDGPNSDRTEELINDTVEFTRERNVEELSVGNEQEQLITEIQLDGSENTQLDMHFAIVCSTVDAYINCDVNIYDNNHLVYSYPFKSLGNGRNTLSVARVLEKIKNGAHIFELKITNHGSSPLIVENEYGVFSMLGKFANMDEPAIPVINVYDYVDFSLLDATENISTMANSSTLFDMTDTVRFTF